LSHQFLAAASFPETQVEPLACGMAASIAKELSWFAHLARSALEKKTAEGFIQSHRSCSPLSWLGQTREWPAFELADAMEQGLAQQLTSHFTKAPSTDEKRELTIGSSDDGLEHVLLSEEEKPLLIARTNVKDRRIDILAAGDGATPCALGPAFQLTYSADQSSWRLCSTHCETCSFRPPTAKSCTGQHQCTLMTLHQEKCQIGQGNAMCIKVELSQEGDALCDACRRRCCCSGSQVSSDCITLASRKPKWSRRLRSLTLDFGGRCSEACIRNFQLVSGGREDSASVNDVLMQYGKMADNTYCLDFKAPLGIVQAFAAALTATFWD